MKKFALGAFLVLLGLSSVGQIINFETGKVLSRFDYKNSSGDKLEGLKSDVYSNLGAGARFPLFNTNFHALLNANYNRYGAKGSDPVLGNYYEWDVKYIGVCFGFDYEFNRPEVTRNEQHGFSYYIRAAISTEFLMDGMQNLNNQISNLKGVEEFDRPIYSARATLGFNYYINKTYILFGQYTGGRSFLIGDYANKEQLRFTTHSLSIGLAINLMYFQ